MDPIFWWMLGGAAAGALAGGTAPEEQETLSYEQDPAYQAITKGWAQEYAKEYPEFPGMPEQIGPYGERLTEMLSGEVSPQVGKMGTELSRMLGGELAPAVLKYLTSKYQQAWSQALPGLADIGAGPGTLASLRLQAGERQAVEGAYMGQQQIGRAMEYMPQYEQMRMAPQIRAMELMPQYTQMMLSPYMADVAQWGNIGDLLQQNFPGADVADTETGLVDPATVTRGPSGSKERREWLRQNEKEWIARYGEGGGPSRERSIQPIPTGTY